MVQTSEWRPVIWSNAPCRKCGEKFCIEVRKCKSSCGGHEDLNYRCTSCGASWWIDGPDA